MSNLLNKMESAVVFVDNIIERITSLFWLLGGLCIVAMAFVVFHGALMRHVFRDPPSLTYPVSSILMLACVVFSIPYVQKLGKHLRLDLLDNVFPNKVSGFIKYLLGPLSGLCFGIVLTWQSWNSVTFAIRISEMTKSDYPIPTFPLKLMVTIFMGILCLVFILQILKYLFMLRKHCNGIEKDNNTL